MAQTLGELERKLGELERELAAVGGGGNSRVVDEAVDPATAARAPTPAPAAPSSNPPASAPPSAPPDRDELLRFRERLERTAAELARVYDELLGRLSFAAVPAPAAGPTISFARGAPSLDIAHVEGLREAGARALERG